MVRPSRRTLEPRALPEAQWEAGVDNGSDGIDFDTGPYVDGTLTVEESDGSPSVAPVTTLELNATDFTVVDNGDGSVSVTTDEPDAAAHIADATDAHDASAVSIADAGGYFTATEVEGALQELGAGGGGGGVIVQDEGSPLATTATTLDFVGAGVTASGAGATKTITIPGGGGGLTIQYPGLKPGTPTYDHAGAALDGAFVARSNQGSFATTNCKTQGEDWGGSACEMQFSAQNGGLYVAHGNTDLDFHVGGFRKKGMSNQGGLALMFGIAALNSSGTGVGIVVYNDSHIYLATITTWNYSGNSDSWLQHGQGVDTGYDGDWWLRLKRVSGTWTAYASQSGRAWDKTFATRADSITVDRLYVGVLFNTGTSYSGRLTHDYLQVDV
jgi:hypothetical protein